MHDESMIADARRGHWLQFALLAIIVALAVAVRVAWIAYANVNPLDGRFDDTVFYFTSAQSLARDFTFRLARPVMASKILSRTWYRFLIRKEGKRAEATSCLLMREKTAC